MMAKIKDNIASFGGRVNYVNNPKEKNSTILASNGLLLESNRTITESFNFQAAANPRVTNPSGHIAIGFALQDKSKMTDELMTTICLDYMARMGITETQFLLVRHRDKDHDHAHLLYNRVNYDRKTINANNFKKNMKVCRELSQKYGLYISSGNEQMNLDHLRGKEKHRYELMAKVTEALEESHSWDDFKEALLSEGVTVEFRFDKVIGERVGISFKDGKYKFKGSALGKDKFSLPALDRYFKYEEAKNKVYTDEYNQRYRIDPEFPDIRQYEYVENEDVTLVDKVHTDEPFDINNAFDFSQKFSDSGSSSADEGSGIGRKIAAAALELAMGGTEIAQTSGGGGNSSSGGWRDDDDDKEENKNKYKRKGRR